MSPRHALVIGAGLGGLAAAARLRHLGYRVTLVERHAVPGGRCGLWESEGFRFDTGPTLLLMVDYLRALFRDLGRRLEDCLELVQLEPNYRVHYADGRHDNWETPHVERAPARMVWARADATSR